MKGEVTSNWNGDVRSGRDSRFAIFTNWLNRNDYRWFAAYSGEVFGCNACCSLSFTSRNCLNFSNSFAASSLFPMRR